MTTNISYAKAYTQALGLLKHLPVDDYNKIPKSEIEFLEKNKDSNYNFNVDFSKPLEEQDISVKTHSIIVRLFRDYFANENQKKKLEIILKYNLEKTEKEKRNKFNSFEIFRKH